MSVLQLNRLGDHARVFLFGADRPLTSAEAERMQRATERFLEDWTAHGAPLCAGLDVLERRFLLVAVDEALVAPSGCAIDALTGHVRSLEEQLGIRLLDGDLVWYRDEDGIRCVARSEFRRLAGEGRVGPDTVVFDLTVERLGAVRAGAHRPRAGDAWHARLLARPAARPSGARTP